MKLLIASNNPGKAREIREIFSGAYDEILTMDECGLNMHVTEDGQTFLDNAVKKAFALMEASGMDTLADDSGLEVDALSGAPGVRSARFAGEGATDAQNNEKLLDMLRGIPMRKRGARFVCTLALARPGKPMMTTEGYAYGTITEKTAGEAGFGYDPLFYSPEHGMTFAQMPPETKNSLSHRRKALEKLKEKLALEDDQH